MGTEHASAEHAPLLRALQDVSSSTRLRAALAAGTRPDPRLVDPLVARCATEPDFFVRDMLTWALTRHEPATTVPRLVAELGSDTDQARSQALHTLSKIGDRSAWPAVTRALLTDADDEVARTAWRAAVVLAPEDETPELARVLGSQLGRGSREVRRSLSRALVALGDVASPVLEGATTSSRPAVRVHAIATQHLLRDPDAGFDHALAHAEDVAALGPAQAGEAG
ncbi:HEAT repeat domain-containing protein [Rhodococcus sp. X156]|uniref:HEAT repeat domain-containing protein n=1 Tax=Rhodococcus sp. X156 TaxID=2499145 RepID=UPI000FD75A8C|nr:HEAT repeat domain-containing protein [Rhodococcus sp. X156]